jgi:hypothetical protein
MKLSATWFKTGETIEADTLAELAAEFARRGFTVAPYSSYYSWTEAYDETGRQRGWVQAGEWASY